MGNSESNTGVSYNDLAECMYWMMREDRGKIQTCVWSSAFVRVGNPSPRVEYMNLHPAKELDGFE